MGQREERMLRWVESLEDLTRRASTAPWIAASGTGAFDNWLIATMGEDDNGTSHFVTTDGVRASDFDGNAEDDARFIAAARQAMPVLLRFARARLERDLGGSDDPA